MADTPDIVIRTAEERRAEENAAWSYLLIERPGDRGIVLSAEREEPVGDVCNVWRFPDMVSLRAWVALRSREMLCEGVEAYSFTALCADTEEAFPDKRMWVSLWHRIRAPERKLKW